MVIEAPHWPCGKRNQTTRLKIGSIIRGRRPGQCRSWCPSFPNARKNSKDLRRINRTRAIKGDPRMARRVSDLLQNFLLSRFPTFFVMHFVLTLLASRDQKES
ncbi:unnamed protein product [Amoebophrya sp. A120]|nr:unnamed protein product [Amoebophrya sp. A120]|eukprot:GSA120T00023321001.1